MPVMVGYANGNKYYYNSEGSGGVTLVVPEDDVEGVSSTIKFNTLEDEMSYYGMTTEQIRSIMDKINGVSTLESTPKPVVTTDSGTGVSTTNLNGSLLSNSAQSLKNTTDFQKATIEIEKQKLNAMNVQNQIEKKKLDLMDYNLIMQSQFYSQMLDLNENLKSLTTATKEQTLKANVTVDTGGLTNVIKEIGVSQKSVNEKQLEKLNIELEKDITFDGKTYNKTELSKIKDLETLKNVKDENDTLLNDGLELLEEFMTDGFDLDINPFAVILGELKKEFDKDSLDIQTKYNLK